MLSKYLLLPAVRTDPKTEPTTTFRTQLPAELVMQIFFFTN
jgi:hypothetical protein